ncbi:MAG: tetratricopeptide repeat protein [Thermoanaerobaculia bacterium]
MPEPAQVYDVFLSHGSPDKPWVETLAHELEGLGLKPFLDARAIEPAANFPLVLSDAIAASRFLVLVLSPQAARPWVNLEWPSFLAHHGPQDRLIPVMLEPAEVPPLLAALHRIDATDRDAARVAREIARIAGRPGELKEGDVRRLVIGQDLTFVLGWEGEDFRITDPLGNIRTVPPPWKVDNRFGIALHFYSRLSREPVSTDAERADLVSRATTLGSLLFDLLFDAEGLERLRKAMVPGRPRPLITLRSGDDLLLSLPWELLYHDGSFLLRDARVDLARSTPGEVGPEALLREPADYLKLVVNVSAPSGSGLNYEEESYRITRALSEKCHFVPTELGTLEDLADTVRAERPTAIHFSGHGAPGALAFEDEEGQEAVVSIHDLLSKLRQRIDGSLPPLFYLASCHGNDPGAPRAADPEAGKAGAESSAARLHREGVPQVVGYYGPIVDELSTRAEVAFYRALAEGETTRYAIRQAREALAKPFAAPDARHRPRAVAEPGEVRAGIAGTPDLAPFAQHSHPFAWAQLVLYHRGPDFPLSLPAAQGTRTPEAELRRTFEVEGDRRILTAGFIGRRTELHRVRRRIREGERIYVFQGLGGLGKSTLSFQVLPMLLRGEGLAITLWCQETEDRPDRAAALVDQLLDLCRKQFGLNWEPVVHQIDRIPNAGPVQRFEVFVQVLLQNLPRLVLYLDNLESLLIGPKEADAENDDKAIGDWASPDLAQLWEILTSLAQDGDRLYLVASCRYRNPDFAGALLPVTPLPPDALFRLMSWFPALRRLSPSNRARLVGLLAGHPRAVEYANDLLAHALAVWEDRHGPWPEGEDPEREWKDLIAPVLPKVQDKLWANLLLGEMWDRVLDDHARRMLYRMTLLRRPWEWELMAVLGEEGEGEEAAFETAERLRRTSLLEQVDLVRRQPDGKFKPTRHYTLHPATIQFVRQRFGEDDPLRKAAHRRLGDHLEDEAKKSSFLEVILEAGHHLFEADEYDRAYELLGPASDWLQVHGRVREGLQILDPFLAGEVREALAAKLLGRLLGTVGLAYVQLGEVEKAIGYYEQPLVIAREIGDRRGEGNVLGNLGSAYFRLGEVEKAIDYYEQQLVIVREIGDRTGEGNALSGLGIAYRRLGEVKKAIGYYEQQLVIVREIGDRGGEGDALGNLGIAYADLGDVEKAVGYYEQQLVIVREIGDRQGEGNALGNLGIAYRRLGEVEKAVGYYEQQLVIVREIGDRRGEGNALGNLGNAYARLGEIEKAIGYLGQALVIGRAIKDPVIVRNFSEVLDRLRKSGNP